MILVSVAYGIVLAASHWVAPFTPATIDLSPSALPVYAGLSTLRMALAYLLSLGFSLVYARIAAYAKSRLARTKTDKADAALIAHFCCTQQPLLWTPPTSEVRELQALVRRVEMLD